MSVDQLLNGPPEAVGDVALDEPGRARPGRGDLVESRVAASTGAKPVRPGRELRFVVGLQQQAHYLTDQFVRPGRKPEGPSGSVLLRDVDPPDRREPVAFGAKPSNEVISTRFGG